jgi:hypothetical protein
MSTGLPCLISYLSTDNKPQYEKSSQLLSFEFITDFIFPYISDWTNDSPLWETFILEVIAALIEPINYRLERWVKTRLVHKSIHQVQPG